MKVKEIEQLKKERDEYLKSSDEYWDKSLEEKYNLGWGSFCVGFILALGIGLGIFAIFDETPFERIGLSEEDLVSWYVLKYYPEFEGCSMEYDACLRSRGVTCALGVNIYCYDTIDKRDGLIPYEKNKEPTHQLELEELNIDDIFDLYLEENLKWN